MRRSNLKPIVTLLATLVVCAAMPMGCGNGSATNAGSSGLLSGNWQIAMQQNPPSTNGESESGFLLQTGNSLTGEFALSDQTQCAGLGSVQGTLRGSDVALTVNQAGETVTLTGTASKDGSGMAGTYSILAASCGGNSSIGTWTASPVKPVTGTYLAVFSSGYTGYVYDFAVSLTQGANTGTSIASLSGKMSSSGALCGNSLNLSGVVSGTSIVFNFLASDGTAVGQFRGTTSADATSMTGTYDFVPQTGGCGGDAGTITVTLQPTQTTS